MGWIKKLLETKKSSTLETGTMPKILPVLPLKDTILMPEAMIPLVVSSPDSMAFLKSLYDKTEFIAATGIKGDHATDPTAWENIYHVACLAQITMLTEKDNTLSIMIKGIKKIRLQEKVSDKAFLKARVSYIEEDLEPNKQVYAMAHATRDILHQLSTLSYHNMESILSNLTRIKDPLIFFSTSATTLPLPAEKKQAILEKDKLSQKYTLFHRCLEEELEILEISSKITKDAKGEITNAQRQYYLKEQLKAIQKELGDTDSEMDELKKDIEEKDLPEEVKKDVDRDLKRISRMQPGSSEYVMIRTYLDWILDLPWNEHSEDNLEITEVERILDKDHFDLKRPKKRILEFLAVKKLKGDLKGPILCLAGPPGVGKTSLGKSIARAMGREFVRISLGGVRDEAEIRGHRRTYIGAMPGRIINGIKTSGTTNPVFMLDEIDKLSMDIHGDPSSALLEALDPEQNSSFVDHYLNVPYDLSKVFFITTANVLDSIPDPLMDRMEVVDIEGYTQEDKLEIAKRFLLSKELEATGLDDKTISLPDEAINHIIRHYTRESGVRNLQRQIASCLRTIASIVVKDGGDSFDIDIPFIEKALGPVQFVSETKGRTRVPGIATGLAWTPFGGVILFIESTLVDGREEMILTGQMGDVMKESARIALSLVGTRDQSGCKDKTLHIHVPA
ncbi:MAG: endopeptidase La, partial [Thermodesulfobacteriota bacterium]|nr:endopeptidase La [Thermodesulfobacteriota bacterium]